jgi:hypothetical protein
VLVYAIQGAGTLQANILLVLHQQAAYVMKHLETKREAAERRRVALMSKGIVDFLDRTSQNKDLNYEASRVVEDQNTPRDSQAPINIELGDPASAADSLPPSQGKESVLDKIRMTLDHAAEIIRESLELTVGGVVFLDTTIGYTENDIIGTVAFAEPSEDINAEIPNPERENMTLQASTGLRHSYTDGGVERHLSQGTIRSATDKHKPSKVLAMSAASAATWDPKSRVLDAKTLRSLINSYPKGNVWYIDDDGYFNSLEQANGIGEGLVISPTGRRGSNGTTKQKAEAAMLSQIFHKARQIIFLPLWDAGAGKQPNDVSSLMSNCVTDRWYSGCFVWSQSAVPVFTVESEVAYLSAFTNSMMVEISRLDAITANKVKSDFISSISRM